MSVIALSGEFAPVTTPLVVADRFLQKGKNSPAALKETIRELLSLAPKVLVAYDEIDLISCKQGTLCPNACSSICKLSCLAP